jgi:hypothetical protein
MAFRDPNAIAERLDKYVDGLTAFVVIQFIAFVVGLANKDFHAAVISMGKHEFAAVFSVVFCLVGTLQGLCFWGEDKLLGHLQNEPKAVYYSMMTGRCARLIIVFLALLFEFIVRLQLFG